MLDSKRLQDRIDSLEFYAKTNTNSSVFHSIPSSYSSSSQSSSNSGQNGSSSLSSRARTPAPVPQRPRIPATSISSALTASLTTSSPYSTSTTASSTTPSYYDRLSSSRPGSRQSSVERSLDSSSSFYNPGPRFSDISSPPSIRSRNSSPSRSLYDSSGDRWSSSTLTRNLTSLPPVSSSLYDSYSSRFKREPSSDRFSSSSSSRPSASSSLLKFRRASFVDNHHSPKYY